LILYASLIGNSSGFKYMIKSDSDLNYVALRMSW
jgi:hypothetical protein